MELDRDMLHGQRDLRLWLDLLALVQLFDCFFAVAMRAERVLWEAEERIL
jgi:hypothetical protein